MLALNPKGILGNRHQCIMRRSRIESEHAPHYPNACPLITVDHGYPTTQAPDRVSPRFTAVVGHSCQLEV